MHSGLPYDFVTERRGRGKRGGTARERKRLRAILGGGEMEDEKFPFGGGVSQLVAGAPRVRVGKSSLGREIGLF